MNIRTTKMILLVFAVAIVLFAIFGIYPMFSDIQEKSEEFILHKKTRAELILRKDELASSKGTLPHFPTGSIDPLDFIEFLEKEAVAPNLSIKITSVPSKQEALWLSSSFGFNLNGSPSDFLAFLEKLESASYLINISSFNIIKGGEENTIQVSLSGNVYGRIF